MAATTNRPTAAPAKAKQEESGSKAGIIIITVLLLLIASVVLVFALDLFNVRSSAFANTVRDIPVVGSVMPAAAQADVPTAPPPQLTHDQWHTHYQHLSAAFERLQSYLQASAELAIEQERQIELLMRYRDSIQAYNEHRRMLDIFIVENAGADAFAQFFQTIAPGNQQMLAEWTAAQIQYDRLWADLADSFVLMQPRAQAETVTQMLMTAQGREDVVRILSFYDERQLERLLSALDIEVRLFLLGLLTPEPPLSLRENLPPALYP